MPVDLDEKRFGVPSSESAPALGRQALEEFVGDAAGHALDDARLLLSEVITNAVRHAGTTREDVISVLLRQSPAELYVEVSDPGRWWLEPREAERPSGGGWGFLLLERLARRWGVMEGPSGGTVVWFTAGLEREERPA
jgi:anti-sigma regulatory factor (Ser/Thr protein kinase)